MEIFIYLWISFVINMIACFWAWRKQTDKYTDLAYVVSFVWITFYAYGRMQGAQGMHFWMNILLILTWALRLGTYLYSRIKIMKADTRFDNIRKSGSKLFTFFTFQALLVWIVNAPTYVILRGTEVTNNWSYIFVFIALFAIGYSGIADVQKFRFKLLNKNGFIKSGLWGHSRHPNYFGEILFWTSLSLFAITFTNKLPFNIRILALISPIAISATIIFISGIPILQKRYEVKFGNNPEYIEYKNSTPLLIPYIGFTKTYKNWWAKRKNLTPENKIENKKTLQDKKKAWKQYKAHKTQSSTGAAAKGTTKSGLNFKEQFSSLKEEQKTQTINNKLINKDDENKN